MKSGKCFGHMGAFLQASWPLLKRWFLIVNSQKLAFDGGARSWCRWSTIMFTKCFCESSINKKRVAVTQVRWFNIQECLSKFIEKISESLMHLLHHYLHHWIPIAPVPLWTLFLSFHCILNKHHLLLCSLSTSTVWREHQL